jgi:hypothetical protein
MPLSKKVTGHRKLKDVEVFYADRPLVKYWNKQRPEDMPQFFCGYFWINGVRHNGPFQSYSAAIRDAYFVNVLGQTPEVPMQKARKK